MDVNVKNLDAPTVARLAEQAKAEGMSQQEWMRQALRRTAERLSPSELVHQRTTVVAMTHVEFAAVRAAVVDRRRRALEALGAPGRGR